MESGFHKLTKYKKKQIWTVIVAYMVGIHNFYKEEDKASDDIGSIVEVNEAQEDGAPKD